MMLHRALVAIALACVAGCDGFKTIQPDGNVIISVRNDSLKALDTRGLKPVPELPTLPPGTHLGQQINPSLLNAVPLAPSKRIGVTPFYNALRGTPTEADLSVFPYNTAARTASIYPSTPPGVYSQCSAQFVGNSDVLMTAAHCVYNNQKKEWIRQYSVYRGYRNQTYAQQHDWECAAIFSGWTSGAWQKDYAFIKMRDRAPDWMGLDYYIPNAIQSIGYPSNYYANEILMRVNGNVAHRASVTRMDGNPFAPGSSGGAWHDAGNAVSVNSFRYSNAPNSMWGPTLDGDTRRLFDYVQNGCTDSQGSRSISIFAKDLKPRESVLLVDDSTRVEEPFLASSNSTCSCGKEQIISNQTSEAYQVQIRETLSPNRSKTQTFTLQPGEQKPLGCPRVLSSKTCARQRKELVAATRLIRIARRPGDKDAHVTPEMCKSSCLKMPIGRECFRLGISAATTIAPLAGFINEDLRKTPKDGIVATKADLILRFGGDPSKSNDPCARGDFIAGDGVIWNSGLSCRAITSETDAEKTRLSMQAPSYSEARPSQGVKITSFDRRDFAPAVTFVGPDSGELQRRFGGRVVSAQSVSDQLIVTTENGCLVASER